MRTLVEQTHREVQNWLEKLNLTKDVKSHLMMGGDVDNTWEHSPEKECVIIGTQDQLLSRALNRGYSMSRSRWPLHFGLMNNDSLWVFDEIQFMGVGLATSCQLQAFRETMQTFGITKSLWVSATLQKEWLKTIDFQPYLEKLELCEISEADQKQKGLRERLEATKLLSQAQTVQDGKNKKYEQQLAAEILQHHKPGHRTLVIVNTVQRAVTLYEKLKKIKKGETEELRLLHSRYRQPDREEKQNHLKEFHGILIATQVVEAGVDISSKTLFTELAPWSSLVQRFGRNNREGEYKADNPSKIFWIDLHEKVSAPYDPEELTQAREELKKLDNVGPNNLPEVHQEYHYNSLLRHNDLMDLFDTTPDIAGNDVDISRYIREGEEVDVQLFWRDYDLKKRIDELDEKAPLREELCSVTVTEFKKFYQKIRKGDARTILVWDFLDESWQPVRNENRIYPGQQFLLHKSAGGYEAETGWNGKSKSTEPLEHSSADEEDSTSGDLFAKSSLMVMEEHIKHLKSVYQKIAETIHLSRENREVLEKAIELHDLGKGHAVFQDAIQDSTVAWREQGYSSFQEAIELSGKQPTPVYAKAEQFARYKRPGFRHELASALAILRYRLAFANDEEKNDLVAYLAAAHHGKVRLSIRSMPNEKPNPENPNLRFARGIYEEDLLYDYQEQTIRPLDLEYMELGESEEPKRKADCQDKTVAATTPKILSQFLEAGGDSWSDRILSLLDRYGPFRLAWLEAMIKVIDERGSKTGDEGGTE